MLAANFSLSGHETGRRLTDHLRKPLVKTNRCIAGDLCAFSHLAEQVVDGALLVVLRKELEGIAPSRQILLVLHDKKAAHMQL